MRHWRKGCGRTDKEELRGASRRQHKRERRGVCVSVRATRMSEAAVKRSDLANFDPDMPLEKLRWAREEMQRNF